MSTHFKYSPFSRSPLPSQPVPAHTHLSLSSYLYLYLSNVQHHGASICSQLPVHTHYLSSKAVPWQQLRWEAGIRDARDVHLRKMWNIIIITIIAMIVITIIIMIITVTIIIINLQDGTWCIFSDCGDSGNVAWRLPSVASYGRKEVLTQLESPVLICSYH